MLTCSCVCVAMLLARVLVHRLGLLVPLGCCCCCPCCGQLCVARFVLRLSPRSTRLSSALSLLIALMVARPKSWLGSPFSMFSVWCASNPALTTSRLARSSSTSLFCCSSPAVVFAALQSATATAAATCLVAPACTTAARISGMLSCRCVLPLSSSFFSI